MTVPYSMVSRLALLLGWGMDSSQPVHQPTPQCPGTFTLSDSWFEHPTALAHYVGCLHRMHALLSV